MEESLIKFTRDGKFLMLALDHRGSFSKLMDPENPGAVPNSEMIELKREIIKSVFEQCSGLLIDVEIGLPALDGMHKPYLLPIEKTGYRDVHGERLAELEYEAAQIKELGASGVKLLVYFNPNYESAPGQMQVAREVIHDVMTANIPSFVEIVTYKKEGEVVGEERVELVLRSLERFIENGVLPDVFKLQYPGSKEACAKVTKAIGKIPWIMLTGGDDFDQFKQELKEAVEGGCVGFLAGRALWKEVMQLEGEEKKRFLDETLPNRFREICEIVTD